MKHLFFFFHIISFLAGFICAGFALFIYKIKKDERVKYFLLVLLAYMLILLEQTITSYSLANSINNSNLSFLTGLTSALGCALTIYYLPNFVFSFTDKESAKISNVIVMSITGIFTASVILYYILPIKFFFNTLGNMALVASIVYSLIALSMYAKTGIDSDKRKIIMNFFTLTLVFLPYMVLDMKIERLPGIGRYFPYGIFSVPMFLLVSSILALYYGYREFKALFLAAQNEDKASVSKEGKEGFYIAYNITKRESEIIELLMKGYSYNRISEELVVALSTVKSHVYNIYQKTGVKSKIELLNLINNLK